jgi:DNA polymerase-3 subunit alpha
MSKYIPFINLHSHSVFSYFDGLCFPYEHYENVFKNGENAMAITDHGNMCVLPHQLEAQERIKKIYDKKFRSIFGVEAYFVPSLKDWRKEYEIAKENRKNQKNKDINEEDEEGGIFLEDEDASKKEFKSITNRRYHLLLLAQNQIGLNNLFSLVSESYKMGNFYKYPRIDFDILRKYNKGVICSSACIGGPLAGVYYRNKDNGQDVIIDKMRVMTQTFLDIFGDNWYGELQWNNKEIQHIMNQYIIQLSYEMGFKCISTSDSHYPTLNHWKDREIYKRLGWLGKSKKPEWVDKGIPQSIDEIGFELFPKNGQQMWESYEKYASSFFTNVTNNDLLKYDDEFILKTIERTKDITENKIEDFQLERSVKLPNFIISKDEEPEITLTKKCIEGLKKLNLHTNKEYVDRLKYELKVVKDRGFSKYFLTMKEIVDKAKENQLVGISRGSAGGALTSYVLGITQLDPIKWGLQFERFLSKNSNSYPDIDIDFSDPVALKEQLKKEWGEYSVVQITNFNTLQLKSLVKDVSKLYGISWQETNMVTTSMMLESIPLAKKEHGIEAGVYTPTYEEMKKYSKTFQKYLQMYPEIEKHIEVLQGQIRSLSAHASGTLVSEELNKHMPLINVGGKIQTSWTEGQTNRHLEPLGFIKFDILGLASLRMIEITIKHVLERHFNNPNPTFEDIRRFYKDKLSPEKINFNDKNVWENIFHKGNFIGVFQFTNSGAQEFCKKAKPNSIGELSDLTAIYRPGPLSSGVDKKYLAIKNEEEVVEYIHPIVKEVLEETKNQIIYQEQIATLAHKLGKNISLDEGNQLRKVLTKKGTKKEEEVKNKLYNKFLQGCLEKGISQNQVEELWQTIIYFSGYGFNKSHSIAYSIVSYICAYLLNYYPLEWMISFLEKEPEERKEKAISLVKKSGILIDPININTSNTSWEISKEKENTLIQPFLSIKGLGMAAIEQILQHRPFTSVNDILFRQGIVRAKFNKKSLDVLAKSGGLDDLWKKDDRFKHLKHFWLSCINELPKTEKKLNEQIEKNKDEIDFTFEEKIDFLTNVTGIYPLDMVISEQMSLNLKRKCIPPISEYDRELQICWGVPKNIEIKLTKNGKEYYVVEVIDENFSIVNVRCWGINKEKDKIYVNHPYLMKLNYSDEWGFSNQGFINQSWKLIG